MEGKYMSENNEKKFVTWEMFKKYHENLVGYIDENDDSTLNDGIIDEVDNE